jgi:Zn finger protein HypA/HybF involved in hydrogenase expression
VDSIVSPHVFDVFFDTFFAEANFEGMSISLDDDNKKQVCPSCINTERILSISNKLEECLKLSRDNPFADACYQFDDARRELRS